VSGAVRWRMVGLMAAAALVCAGCEREARRFTATPPQPVASAPRLGSLQPAAAQEGDVRLAVAGVSPDEGNAFGVNQGKRLYRWYNCSGCHGAGGGGAIGPALMDDQWKYGSTPEAVYASIMQGRPEGMPSFGGHIPQDQVWQLVAYVRSMSGQLRKDVEPSRADALSGGEAENARTPQQPRPADPPPKPAMGGSR
jgi:cytochrome c oxidase cbb3-type subunit 3